MSEILDFEDMLSSGIGQHPAPPYLRIGTIVEQNDVLKRENAQLKSELEEAAKTHSLIETDLRRRLDNALSRMGDAGLKLVLLQRTIPRIHETANRRMEMVRRLISVINKNGDDAMRSKAIKSIGDMIA